MRYGIVLPGGGMSMVEMIAIARRAEERGLDSVYCVEAWRDALVPLAAIATATNSIKIGPYILNVYGRSPWLAGMSIVDLDELCTGRLVLCIGIGNRHINEAYQGITVERPSEKMEEYVHLLRRILAARLGETVTFEGKFHGMRNWPPAVEPLRPSIPIYLAAVFPSMRKVAGRVADGAALGVLCSPSYIRDVIGRDVRESAEAVGRDPDSVALLGAALVVVSDDREAARDAIRTAVCSLFSPLPHPYYAFLMCEQGFAPVVDDVARHMAAGSLERACEAVPDDLVDGLAIAGSADYCRERLAAFDGIVGEMLLVNGGATTGAAGVADVVASYDTLMTCVA